VPQQDLGSFVEVPCQDEKQPIANAVKITQRHEHVAQHQSLDSSDLPREGVESAPQLVFIVAQQSALAAPPIVKPSFGCFGTKRGAAHRRQWRGSKTAD
jgi:hypothetical protein